MKNWRDYLLNWKLVSIPTKTDFRSITTREILVFEGPQGVSEFSPFLEYGSRESGNWARAALEAAYIPFSPNSNNLSININITLPRIPNNQVDNFLQEFPGCLTIKAKINNFEEDYQRLAECLRIDSNYIFRLDINGGWDLEKAKSEIALFHQEFGDKIQYIEQPVTSIEDMKKLKELDLIALAADETIRKNLEQDFSKVQEIADFAIIKWQPVGGFQNATTIAKQLEIPIVVSSALESGIGIYHGLNLASHLVQPDIACGLGTVNLLTSDILSNSPKIENGVIKYQKPKLDENKCDFYQASPQRQDWWENRLDEIWLEYLLPNSKKWGWDFL